MKVEFLESEVFGPKLVVSGSDFLKAKNNEREMDSLFHALDAFLNLFDVDFRFGSEEYTNVCNFINRSGSVIFNIDGDGYERWRNVYVSNNNQPIKIYGIGRDGQSIERCKFNPRAIEKIRRRHERGDNA